MTFLYKGTIIVNVIGKKGHRNWGVEIHGRPRSQRPEGMAPHWLINSDVELSTFTRIIVVKMPRVDYWH